MKTTKMKKMFLLFACLLLSVNIAHANNNLTFLYINGSNNDDLKMKNWYENGVKKLHPILRDTFLNDKAIKAWSQNHGKISIEKEPLIYFWGFKSKESLEFVNDKLDLAAVLSSFCSYKFKKLLTAFMHDAIWVQKSENMLPILDELNEMVKSQHEKNNSVVLYGYSAGTFITYEYLLNKIPYIDSYDFFKYLKADDDILEFISKNSAKMTCVSALSNNNANLGVLSKNGDFVINQNKENFKKNYLSLDDFTDVACSPVGAISGVINFASPLVLFYSNIADPNAISAYYNINLLKYIYKNSIFFMTLNFREDPLGFPSAKNISVEELNDKLNLDVQNPTGAIYDNSSIWSMRSFIFAHTSYWSARKIFSKAIVKSFKKAYESINL